MSYRYILGACRSGKTYRAYTECIERSMQGGHYIVLVPEQASTEAEKSIVRLHPDHAVDNIEVLSFNRLAYRVFEELNIKNPEIIDDITKAMILRRVAADHRKELKIWGRSFDRPGFVDNIKSTISELYQYGITPEQLEKLCVGADLPDAKLENAASANDGNIEIHETNEADDSNVDTNNISNTKNISGIDGAAKNIIRGSLRYKLHDMYVIYNAFADFIKNRYITMEEIPDVLARNIYKSEIIKNSVIVLDGFTGFTPIQYRIIENLLVYAKEVIFTVTWGSGESLFRMSREMRSKIDELAEKNQIRHGLDADLTGMGRENTVDSESAVSICEADCGTHDGADIRCESGISVSPDIAYLEQHFLRFEENQGTAHEKGRVEHDGIRIIKAASMLEEVEAVVCDIEKLVKFDGERYRHIAIICGNIEDYQEILSRVLRRSDMPFYIDHKLGTQENPLAALISSAMGCVSDDYSYDQVMRFLKTGLVTDDTYMVNVLDNYMFVTGRRGYKRMAEEWTYLPKELKGVELQDINTFKNQIISDIEPLRNIYIGKTACVKDAVQALRGILADNNVAEKLSRMSDVYAQKNDAAKAREYAKVYEEVDKVLTRVEDLLGEDLMTCRDLASVLSAGIGQIKVGMIPSAADTIVVGDITRTRLDDIHYLYVLGVNEGVIPQSSGSTGTITDREKEILGQHGMTLSPTAKEDIYIQRYYLYRLFTNPSVRLTLSCAGMDGSGKAMRESYILQHIRSLYEKVPEAEAASYITAYDTAKALNIAADLLRERPAGADAMSSTDALVAYLQGSPEYADKIRQLAAAAGYKYEPIQLDEETSEALYGGEVTGSVTRFENYARCPFMQFAQYGLEIRDLEKYSIQSVDIGNLVHSALEKIFTKAQREKLDLTVSDAQALDEMTENAVTDACFEDETGRYADTAKSKYIAERLRKSVRLNLDMLIEQLREDGFMPRYLELEFDSDGVRGKIDRVDTKQLEDGRTAVRIIDYKTGDTRWDVTETVQGRTTQLPVYMDAALRKLSCDDAAGTQATQKDMRTEAGAGWAEDRSMSVEASKVSEPGPSDMAERTVKAQFIPAGMLYYHVDEPILDGKNIDKIDMLAELYQKMTPEGLINLEVEMPGAKARGNEVSTKSIEKLLEYVKEGYAATREEILGGAAAASPYRRGSSDGVCAYCKYRAICGFDQKLPGYRYRSGLKLDEVSAWEMVLNRDVGDGAGQSAKAESGPRAEEKTDVDMDTRDSADAGKGET